MLFLFVLRGGVFSTPLSFKGFPRVIVFSTFSVSLSLSLSLLKSTLPGYSHRRFGRTMCDRIRHNTSQLYLTVHMLKAGVSTPPLGVYLHRLKTRARWAEGFHNEIIGHVFDPERDGLRQVVPCP